MKATSHNIWINLGVWFSFKCTQTSNKHDNWLTLVNVMLQNTLKDVPLYKSA
jgi:hypothetical protein